MKETNGTNDTNTQSIRLNSGNLKVAGHRGTWYVLDEIVFNCATYFLLEHETYGEDADHIVIDASGALVMEEVVGGVEEALERFEDDFETGDDCYDSACTGCIHCDINGN